MASSQCSFLTSWPQFSDPGFILLLSIAHFLLCLQERCLLAFAYSYNVPMCYHFISFVLILSAGPLMVIVEYCKYGNLSNYLRGKRGDFIVCKVRHVPQFF